MELTREELKSIAHKWNYRPDHQIAIERLPMPRAASAKRQRAIRLKLEDRLEELKFKKEFEL